MIYDTNMVTINLNFNNFSGLPIFLEVFGSFDNNYEYTAEGLFRRKAPPFCPRCSSPMVIMVITYTPKKGLGTSKSEDTSVQIVTVHLKKTVVSGRVLSLFFLIRLTISSDYSDLTMFHMKEFLPLWILYIQDQKALFSENSARIWGKRMFHMTKMCL